MRRIPLRTLAALLAVVTLAPACATESTEDLGSPRSGGGLLPDPNLGVEIPDPIAPGTGLDDRAAPTSDQVVEAALADVEDFWARSYEGLYDTPYEPIDGGFWPYGPTTDQPPCGDPPPAYSDIAENAFYCPSADLIAWDAVNLVPALYDQFGGFTLGIVFAHEFGHAIQSRSRTRGATISLELQADCFAGAWTADVEAGNSQYFEVGLDDLDRAVAGFLALRDGVGTDATDPATHGTGFDRIGAFVDGFELGLDRCVAYPELITSGDIVVVEVPFTDPTDFATGGNLPLDQLGPLVLEDLENFWQTLFTERGDTWTPVTDVIGVDPAADSVTCGGETFRGDRLVNVSFYCVDSDTIYLDAVNLIPALNAIGDYAVATEIARRYAYAAQVRLGNEDNDLASNLQADCFTGVYAASGFLGNRDGEGQTLFLSPGDLDEAVIAFLLDSDPGDGDLTVGTAFQRFDAYRSGFLDGTSACDAPAP